MATIPQTVDEQQPNYLGYSHGFTSSLAAVGGLIGDTGETIKSTAAGIQNTYDVTIGEEARKTFEPMVEGERQVLSGAQAVAQAGGGPTGGKPPPGLQQNLDKVDKLQSAVSNGKMLESAFWNRLENEAKAMRAKYPGFQDLVDKHISKIVGGNPANQTIQNLFQEQRSAAGSEANLYNHFLKEAIDLGIGGTITARISQGSPPSLTDLMGSVNTRKKELADIQQANSQMSAEEKQNTLDKHRVGQQAMVEANQYITQAWKAGTAGKSYDEVQKIIGDKMQKLQVTGQIDKGWTPEETAQLNVAMNNLEKELNLQINDIFTRQRPNGLLYAKYLDKKSQEDIKSVVLDRFNILKQSIYDKDYGVQNLLTLDMKMREQNDVRALLSDPGQGPMNRLIQAQKNIGGQYWMQSNVFTNFESLKDASKFNLSNQLLKLAATPEMIRDNGKLDPGTGISVVRKWQDAGDTDPKAYRALIDKHLDTISMPNAPADVRARAAQFLFQFDNKDFLHSKTKDGQIHETFANPEDIYLKMASPKMVQGMQEVRKTDETAWNNYRSWMSHNFELMTLKAGSKIQRAQAAMDPHSDTSELVYFNPETLQYEAKAPRAPNQIINPESGLPIAEQPATVTLDLQNAITDMNKAVTGMAMVIKGDGKDPKQVLPGMLNSIQMRTDGDPGNRGANLFSRSMTAQMGKPFTGAMGTTIAPIETPLGRIQVNSAYADRFAPLTEELAGLKGVGKNEGGYAARYARRENGQTITDSNGRPVISQHAHGNAVDIQVANNPTVRERARAIAKANGFKVLEYNNHMHFEIDRTWKPEETATEHRSGQ